MSLPGPLWCWVFAGCVATIGAADALVLDLTKGYFGTGYNGIALHGRGERAAFFALGALLDAALLGAVWCLVFGAARVLRAGAARAIALAAAIGVAIPLAIDLALHRLHRVLGDVLELGVLVNLAAGSWGSALGEAAQDLPPAALLALLGVAGGAAGAVLLRRAEARFAWLARLDAPRIAALALAFAVSAAGSGAVLAWSSRHASRVEFGLAQKPAGRAIAAAIGAVSDVDRDGYGLLAQPADPAPFDSRIHPDALDLPGNGIDENGWGGDLPPSTPLRDPIAAPAPRPRPHAPSVVLIFLESFRDDLIGAEIDGRPITPVLSRLATQGARGVAYAHTPVTWASRASLMQGRVVPARTADTLIDDFTARGYEVAWFSGQHDGVAGEEARLGTERANRFYDAREDVARRTSRSAQPISLQVSWKTVTERVFAYLDERESNAPLFLYVNLVDTHFPYWHRELDDALGVGALARGEIRPENRERVWRAYANAAANVDRAIGTILARTDRVLGTSSIVVVTADHGQAFYENRMLGHGQALDDAQTRVPLVVRGIGSELRGLFGLSDLRGAIGRWTDGVPAAASDSPLLQWVGEISRARRVGLRTAASATHAELRAPLTTDAERQAVHVWEMARHAAAAARQNGAGSPE
jgi:hypothetical protein